MAESGSVRVYLEFLQQVHALVAARGHRMQFWGDIIIEQPELIAELPRDAIALEWGYEADHPFVEHAQRFADSGLEFVVCPGTSSWYSFAGRADNAIRNLALAAVAGREAGARGYLITDWGDFGHLQPLSVSLPRLPRRRRLRLERRRGGGAARARLARPARRLGVRGPAAVRGARRR